MPLAEPPDLIDYSTKAGAEQLATRIQRYWHERGHRTVVVETFVVPGTKNRCYGVRSNLVNGLPPARRERPRRNYEPRIGSAYLMQPVGIG